MPDPLAWQENAACARDVTFTDRPFVEQAPICRVCTVRFECLELGLSQPSLKESDTVTYGGVPAVKLVQLARERRGLPPAVTNLDNHRRRAREERIRQTIAAAWAYAQGFQAVEA
ncbi:MAG TPA: hypothetical protein VGK17_03090 [Propionicimonas sp.]|jgi:hypothetical protein